MNIFICMHVAVLPFLCHINGGKGQPNITIVVERKVNDYGQNLQLFCKIDKCCPKDAGWTVDGDPIFIDIKIFIQKIDPNYRYDATYDESGMRLVIKNFTINDLNKTYECTYDDKSVRKFILYDDVFFNKSTSENDPRNDTPTIVGSVVGIAGGAGFLTLLIYGIIRRRRRGKNLLCCVKKKGKSQHPVDEAAMKPLQHVDDQQDGGRPSFDLESQQGEVAKQLLIQSSNKQNEQQWRELFIKIGKEIITEWKTVGRQLGLPDSEINSIDIDKLPVAEKAYSMLQKWRDIKGSSATKDMLIDCLTKSHLKRVAEIVEKHFSIADTKVEKEDVIDKDSWSALFYELSNEIGTEWREVGLNLGFTYVQVESIDMNNDQIKEKVFSLLQQWRDFKGRSVSKGELERALEISGNKRVAEIVEEFPLEKIFYLEKKPEYQEKTLDRRLNNWRVPISTVVTCK